MSKTKLEILLRKPGSEGFKIKEITGSRAYASYRPSRVSKEKYQESVEASSVDGRKHYVLKAAGSADYVSLSERDFFMWTLMDGKRDIKEIMTEVFYAAGSLDAEALKVLIRRLREAGLIEFVPSASLRVIMESQSTFLRIILALSSKLHIKASDPDAWITKVYDSGGAILVRNFMMPVYFILSVFAVSVFSRFEVTDRFPVNILMTDIFAAAAIIPSVIIFTAVHELFHAMACKKFGRRVNGFGFVLWDGFYPNVYIDVSDMYLASRKERFFVSLAGPLSTTALAALFFIPALLEPSQEWTEILYQTGRLNLIIGFLALYPFQFLKMDGYYMLVDVLGFPGLRERSFTFLRKLPSYFQNGRPFTGKELIMASYLVLSSLSTVIFIMYFII